jgi:hypothetical protein
MAGTTTYRFALHRKVPILVICNLRFGYQHVDIVWSPAITSYRANFAPNANAAVMEYKRR